MRQVVIHWNGHTHVYRFLPGQESIVVKRAYVDSRHPERGFSLGKLLALMMEVESCQG